MKITKRQLRRIIKEEKRKLREIEAGFMDPPLTLGMNLSPELEILWGEVEGALDTLTTVLQKMKNVDPESASGAAGYIAEEIHSWRI
jgi:hypothetical protein